MTTLSPENSGWSIGGGADPQLPFIADSVPGHGQVDRDVESPDLLIVERRDLTLNRDGDGVGVDAVDFDKLPSGEESGFFECQIDGVRLTRDGAVDDARLVI